jgi:hypothetical protein
MMELSVEERNSTLDDLHGIRNGSHDGPSDQIIDHSDAEMMVGAMDRYLELCSTSHDAYRMAKADVPAGLSYVQDRELRSYFLKSCDVESPSDAARKMVSYMQYKVEFFGVDALYRPITLSDLDDDTVRALQSGYFQYIGKDTAGRTLIGVFPSACKIENIQSHVSVALSMPLVSTVPLPPPNLLLHLSSLRR